MPLGEAAALAGRCHPLHSEAYDPAADREALEHLAAQCGRFSPLVGIEDSAAPDSLLLDTTGIAHFFGGENSLASRIVQDFARRGLVVRLAIADTLGAAWAVSHFGQERRVESRERRVESRESRVDRGRKNENSRKTSVPLSALRSPLSTLDSPLSALTIIPPGQTWSALRPLPVEALRLADGVVDLLCQLGVYRIGQLEPLPREDFTARFGPRLIERLDQATGRLFEPIPVHRAPSTFEAHQVLEHPTTRRKMIEWVLEQLIRRVAEKLARGGRGVVRLECRLDCQSAGSVRFHVGLFQATASAEHLMGLAQLQLERLSVAAPVCAVHVEAVVTAVFGRRQENLFFHGPSGEHRRGLAGLVDRLSSRLGRRSVLRARLVSDAQPELAYRYEPVVGAPSGTRRRPSGSRNARRAGLPPRPLRLLKHPVALTAVSVIPDGSPLRFRSGGQEHRIAQSWGPERIETGWWRGSHIGRDYYHVETTAGRRYWLFRQLRDGRWFVHGTFE